MENVLEHKDVQDTRTSKTAAPTAVAQKKRNGNCSHSRRIPIGTSPRLASTCKGYKMHRDVKFHPGRPARGDEGMGSRDGVVVSADGVFCRSCGNITHKRRRIRAHMTGSQQFVAIKSGLSHLSKKSFIVGGKGAPSRCT